MEKLFPLYALFSSRDCFPPYRARLPTSQAATGAQPDQYKPQSAGIDSPSDLNLKYSADRY